MIICALNTYEEQTCSPIIKYKVSHYSFSNKVHDTLNNQYICELKIMLEPNLLTLLQIRTKTQMSRLFHHYKNQYTLEQLVKIYEQPIWGTKLSCVAK